MSDLNFEAMPNKLVNYATLDGIAVIELASDAAGAALTEANDRSPNTYTHGMMSDLDDAIIKARFDDDVSCIVLTGNGSSFFSAGGAAAACSPPVPTPPKRASRCALASDALTAFPPPPNEFPAPKS